MSNLTARRDAAIARKATLATGEKLTYEEQRAIAYPCDIDSEHDVGDYVALMHVTTAAGVILEPHRAKVCWVCYLEQFVQAQAIDPDESNAVLRACRIPTSLELPKREPVSYTAPPTLKELLRRYTADEIHEALGD